MKVKRLKLNKRVKKLMLVMAVVLFVSLFVVGGITWLDATKIDRVLASKSYSYLPVEAKNYIKEVYETTGDIVLTEKNKQENMPYLNSQYINYLELSAEEKKDVGYVPDAYVIDYVETENYEATLPSYFNLANNNGNSYVSGTTDQGSLGVCWIISAVENVETLLMWKNKQPFSNESAVFSARQFDYATSTDGMYYTSSSSNNDYVWNNSKNGYRELGGGGNFYLAAFAMGNGVVLTDSSVMPWNEYLTSKKPEEVFNLANSEYEALETALLPMINEDTADASTIASYTNLVKNYVYEYGGLFAGTLSPQSTCGFKNTDGTYGLKVDDCYSANTTMGHAMQLIGWDDNYEYTYCDNGTSHSNYNGTCTSGTKTTGKGAWILRNSWGDGTAYKYVYLTYDSTRVSIGFTKKVASKAERKWDNNYYINPLADGSMYSIGTQSLTLDTKMDMEEKVEQVKFHSFTVDGSYKVTVNVGGKSYNKTITTSEVGIYTVDFSDVNAVITDSTATVTVTGLNSAKIIYDTISLFTSNVDDKPMIETVASNKTKVSDVVSEENPLYVVDLSNYVTLTHFTKNIPAGAELQYKLFKGDEEYTGYFFGRTSATASVDYESVPLDGTISNNFTAGTMYWSDKVICGVTFNVQVLYNGEVLDEFPLKRHCDGSNTTYSNLYLYSNDERNIKTSTTARDLSNVKFLNTDGTGYSIDSTAGKALFKADKHITGWNTKSDGTGTTYTSNELYVYGANHLYAQWADGHQYYVNYYCSNCSDVYSNKKLVSYGEKFSLAENTFVEDDGKTFLHWTIDGTIYYPEEEVVDIGDEDTPYNKSENKYIYSVWSDDYKTISFDANGGTGTMSSINVETDKYARIKRNLFTKDKASFDSWNTKSDGTGTKYYNNGLINTTENLTLYAQWKHTEYKVSFNSNGGSGSMDQQTFEHTISEKINANTFTRVGYTFSGWNTKADGTGTSYTDQQSVVDITSNVETITLYAQWSPNNYTVKFDANGGSGTMTNQTLTYDKEQTLSENKFTYSGLEFKKWNTKKDGTGTSYNNKANVKNLVASGSITLYAQWGEPIEYEIKEYTVDNDNKTIDMIPISTTVSDFKNNIELGTNYSVEVDSKTVDGKQLIYTGGKTKIYKNGELYVEFTNIVRGDVNGNAKVDIFDYIYIMKYIMEEIDLNNLLTKAADINLDNKVNIFDYITIMKRIMEVI